MSFIGDFHTHTCFCDGKNTPEEMVQAAIDANLPCIGISSHMPILCYPNDWSMKQETLPAYFTAVTACKKKYADKIDVLCGAEVDTHGILPSPDMPLDYTIGAVHSVLTDGISTEVDGDAALVAKAIETVYHGDAMRYVRAYYAEAARIVDVTHCDIIGHIDLVTKFNEKRRLFDDTTKEYLKAATDALDALLPSKKPLEINTGAMSRGYLSHPYPALPLLSYWREHGGDVILNSDAHTTKNVAGLFDAGLTLARAAGYESVLTLTKNGFGATECYFHRVGIR